MKNNRLKLALKNAEQTYGVWLTLSHPLIPEILAPAGFDWMVVDMEHTSIELNDLLQMIISIEAVNSIPLVRVGENNPNLIKRVMDAGAYGIIVPNIQTAQEVRNAVSAVKYPPFGTRGVGLYRAHKFGQAFEEYKRWLETESVIVVQIEHINAVENIEEIFSTSGIDAFMIGPYDLSGSIGCPGELDHPEVHKAIEKILDAANKLQIPAGYHVVPPDPIEVKKYRNKNFKFLAVSVDSIILKNSAIDLMSHIKNQA